LQRLPVALHDHLLIKPAVRSRVIMDDVIGQAEVRDVSRELVKWLRTTEGICLPCFDNAPHAIPGWVRHGHTVRYASELAKMERWEAAVPVRLAFRVLTRA